MKVRLVLLGMLSVLFFGCQKTEIDEITREKESVVLDPRIGYLVNVGFEKDEIVQRGDDFVIEGDIVIPGSQVDELMQSDNGALKSATQFYYPNPYYITRSNLKDVKVFINSTSISSAWVTAVNQSLTHWNSIPGSIIHFRKVSSASQANVLIGTSYSSEGWVAQANPCTNGSAGRNLTINTRFDYLSASVKLNTIAHELGHTIGFAHTNGTSNFSTPLHIFGTRSSQETSSVMYRFIHAWSGFTADDLKAAVYVYPESTCPGQWNKVREDSELEITSSGGNIFYISTARRVCALWKNGTGWGDAILSSSAPLAKSGRSLVFDDKNGVLYYLADNNKIYQLKYSGGWNYSVVCSGQWNTPRSDSELEISTSGGNIFYISTDRRVCCLWKNGTGWGDAILSSSAPRAKSGRSLVFDKVNNVLYYLAENNKIYQLKYSSGWKASVVCSAQWNTPRSDTELEVNTSGSHIFYTSTERKVCALWKNGSSWADAIVSPAGATRVRNGGVFHVDQTSGHIFYIGEDLKSYDLYWSSGWKVQRMTPGRLELIAGSEVANDALYYVERSTQHIFSHPF